MTIMKQAIAGKDNEQFLGDDAPQKNPLLEARTASPAKPVAIARLGTPPSPVSLKPSVPAKIAASAIVPIKQNAVPAPHSAPSAPPPHTIVATAPDGSKTYIPIRPFKATPPPHPLLAPLAKTLPATKPGAPSRALKPVAKNPTGD